MTFEDVYLNKRVLITGHTGFKGSWLSLWLLRLGSQVAGYSLEPPTDPNLFHLLGLEGRLAHYTADIMGRERLSTVFAEFRPEIVFHMAAQSLVRVSYRNPALTYETNVMGNG